MVERVRVGDVLRLERRRVVVEPGEEYVEVGVRSFGRGIFHKTPVDGASLGNKRVFRIEPDDLVISNVFAWEGAIAVASCDEAGTIGSHRFMTFVPTDDRIDIGWASWFFRSEPGLELIRRASPGSAGRNRTLAIERFQALEIPLPPMEEQRRVARRLDGIAMSLDGMRPVSIRAAALVQSLVSAMLEGHFSRINEATQLKSTARVRRGRGPEYAVDSGVLAINQACVRWAGIDIGKAREIDTAWYDSCPENGRVRQGDVLVNSTGEGTIGRAAVATDQVDGLPFDSHVLAVRCDVQQLEPRYLAAYLRSPSGQAQIDAAKGANTTKQTELGKAKLEAVMVPVPSLQEQLSFLTELDRLSERLQETEGRVTVRGRLMGALLPAALNEAFTGLS